SVVARYERRGSVRASWLGSEPRPSGSVGLEVKLQGQLDLPRGIRGAIDLAEGSVGNVYVRPAKLRMVERVLRLHSELEVVLVLRPEVVVLEQGQVGCGDARVADVGQRAAGVAEGEQRRLREHRCIEPLGNSRVAELGAVAVVVRPLAESEQRSHAVVSAGQDNGRAGRPGNDAVA